MNLTEAIDEYLVYIKAVRNFSENTIIGYKNDLQALVSRAGPDCDIADISKEDILQTIGELSLQKKSSATINRFISATRMLFLYCKKLGYIQKNPAIEIKTVKMPKKIPAFMTEKEVSKLCDEPVNNEILWMTRDKALFEMLYSSGCRISEMINLKLSDFKNGYSSAIVRGKGNKERYVYFADEAQDALKIYLDDRRKKFVNLGEGGDACPYVFVNQKGGHLTVKGAAYILDRYSGVEGVNHRVTPHAFRHTFATQMLANGADVRLVQELLGHSSISTTQRYTHITTEQLIKTYNNAHPHSDGNSHSKDDDKTKK